MPVIIDGTLGVNAAAITTTNWTPTNITTGGNTTLGDASGDTVTINASTVSIPNGLNFDSNTLIIDATNNRIGVGLASPQGSLHVSGSSLISNPSYYTGTYYWALSQSPSNGSFGIGYYGQSNAVTISDAGYVGIGTSTPGNKLSVSSAGYTYVESITTGNGYLASGFRTLNNASNALLMDTYSSGAAGQTFAGLDLANMSRLVTGNSNTGGLLIGTAGSYPLYFVTSSSERMRITSNGSVGIGTTSPSGTLHVAVTGGGAYFNTAGGIPRLYLGGGNGFGFNRIQGGEDVFFGEPGDTGTWRVRGAGTISLGVGNTATTMTIGGNGGNVGIGATSPSYKLTVSSLGVNTDSTPTVIIGNEGRSVYVQPSVGTAQIYGSGLGFNGYVDTTSNGFVLPAGRNTYGGAFIAGDYNGNFNIYTYNAGTTNASTGTLNTRMRLQVGTAGAIGLGVDAASSGIGITFPATQNASSDPNTLDDYEEGTWSPNMGFSTGQSGSFTYTRNSGYYVKVGRLVHVQAWVAWSAKPSAGTTLLINLPFTAVAGDDPRGGLSITYSETSWNTGTTMYGFAIRTENGRIDAILNYSDNSTGIMQSQFNAGHVPNSGNFMFSGTYVCAS